MDTNLLSPILQAGAFGICALLIWLLWWLLKHQLAAFRGNTQALEGLSGLVASVDRTTQDVRDRLLEFDCPYLGNHDADADCRKDVPR